VLKWSKKTCPIIIKADRGDAFEAMVTIKYLWDVYSSRTPNVDETLWLKQTRHLKDCAWTTTKVTETTEAT
jgi:hypothetical protein